MSRSTYVSVEEGAGGYVTSSGYGGFSQYTQSRNPVVWFRGLPKRKQILVGGLTAVVLLAVILGLAIGLSGTSSKRSAKTLSGYTCPNKFNRSQYDMLFFVVGDWGRGNENQERVAAMMGTLGECYTPDFVVSTGDNFYSHGLYKADDPQINTAFTRMYSHPSLQVPWYAVLGNHDYGELSMLQVATCSAHTLGDCPEGCCYSPYWETTALMGARDRRWNLQQGQWKKSFMGGQFDLIMIDTNPQIKRYRDSYWGDIAHGINSQNHTRGRMEVDAMLGNSSAAWKVVVGHHPALSYGAHCGGSEEGDCKEMQWLMPMLKEHKASLFLSGHEHDQQVIKRLDPSDPTYYVVSGGGSDARTGEFDAVKLDAAKESVWLSDTAGFMVIGVTKDAMELTFYTDNQTTIAHTLTIPKPV